MNLRLVSFLATDKIRLPGLLYEPEKKTHKAAIYLHGNGSSSIFYSTDRMNSLGEKLSADCIAFFPFNNRGAHYMKTLHRMDESDEHIEYGMTYELIKECVLDIDGAIEFLKGYGYSEFYLIGHSTGANKIVVYNKYKPENDVKKYILLAGGDDTGGYYQLLGKNKFENLLTKLKKEIEAGNGRKLISKYLVSLIISHQSLYDTINPDGDYNIFPYWEYMKRLKLSKKSLFDEYKHIEKPTLVIYGNEDEYCYGNVKKCIEILQKVTEEKNNFSYSIIEETNHGFDGKFNELAQIISKWL
jgi:pimeloyl-ACP methyl ester carboxylesterase